MKTLRIVNDQGEEFELLASEFDGYDCFVAANDYWGDNWNEFKVFDGTVKQGATCVNPNRIDLSKIIRFRKN